MAITFDDKEKLFLAKLDDDGSARGNISLREELRWGKKAYLEVREGLLQKHVIALGRGQGGSVKKIHGDEKVLLDAVPLDEAISNPKLMARLGWGRERYWEVRNKLISNGELVVSKGPGGMVSRASEEEVDSEGEEDREEQRSDESKKKYEVDLYPQLRDSIHQGWALQQQLAQPIVEISAHKKGKKSGGGTWSRPDLIMVARRPYMLIAPQYNVEVWSFEVKLPGWDVKAIYEASSNGRYATHSCALLQLGRDKSFSSHADQSDDAARRLGVGLVTFVEPLDISTWNLRVEPVAKVPDLIKMNDFVEDNVSPGGRDCIAAWSQSNERPARLRGFMTCSG